MNIVAATSGDTGSAAICGVRGRDRIRIFVMHPLGRVSPLQERQMTAVLDDNVFNIAVRGTFDDCQNILKALFNDIPFKRSAALGSVNSINWARVLAQIVYYFYGAFRAMEATGAKRVRFAVPTGNFGDVLAGYFAARMGLPVSTLVLATNENDILDRFFRTGVYSIGAVRETLSPSMDIQVASNFERYLFYRLGGDAERVGRLMESFARDGMLSAPAPASEAGPKWVSGSCDTARTLSTIRRYHAEHGCLLDPHTAAGVAVGERNLSAEEPMICLATAHPAKFPEAVRRATGSDQAHHPLLDALENAQTRCDVLPADAGAVRSYVERRSATGSGSAGKDAYGKES
jgi:threonine synthase